ncbi:Polygalacturonase [Diplonema papillatum]|nr:Polygalacturonase [Diplonema papillatum]
MRSMLLLAVVAGAHAGLWVKERTYSKQCDPMDYGAKGDGVANDTLAVQNAIDDCYANSTSGEVVIPTGKIFTCNPLLVKSAKHAALTFETGGVLRMSSDRGAWPDGQDFITLDDITDFVWSGPGFVDGQGHFWWPNTTQFRPRAVNAHGSHLLLKDFTLLNPPNHCLEMYTAYTELDNVTVLAPPSGDPTPSNPTPSHNTDAVDVHGTPFYIHDCYFSTGDDNIAVHANDTLVQNCVFGTGHGASIGSLSSGVFRNITFDNIVFKNTTSGVRIKTDNAATAGLVTDVTYSNLVMENVETAILISQFYSGTQQGPSKLFIDGVTIRNVTATGTTDAGGFQCQDASPCKNIDLQSVSITGEKPLQFVCAQAHGTATGVTPQSCLLN